jgi:hypothetical protein
MIQATSVYILLAIAIAMANLPFLYERVFFVFKPRGGKAKVMGWRLLELITLYFLVGGLARVLETQANGSVYAQNWEFYATTFCLFLVFAFPGFIYRYLWHGTRRVEASRS